MTPEELKASYTNPDPQEAAALDLYGKGYVAPDQTEINANLSEMNAASTDQAIDLLDQKKTVEEKLAPPPPAPDPNAKPEKAPAQGLTFQEAIELFGSDFTGIQRNEDGTYTPDKTALARAGAKTEATEKTPDQIQADKDKADYENAKSMLTNFSQSMETDPALVRVLSGISSVWDARIRQQEQSSASQTAAMVTAGLRYGSTRYGGGSMGPMAGIISAQERAGLQAIANLEGQKNSALAEARSAYESKKWDQYAKLVDLAETKYSESKKAVAELVKTQAAEQKKIKEKEEKFQSQTQISSAFDLLGRDADADEIQGYLKDQGMNVDLDFIDKTLKIINPAESFAGLSPDYRTFKHLQDIKDPAVEGMDFFDYRDAIENKQRTGDIGEFEYLYGHKPTPEELLTYRAGMAAAGRKGEGEEKPLNILDVNRYNELYPDAGVVAGDTQGEADQKVQASLGGKDFTDEELRTAIRDDLEKEKTYEETIAGIDANTVIKNKDRAKLIAGEIYGVEDGTDNTEVSADRTLLEAITNSLFGTELGTDSDEEEKE